VRGYLRIVPVAPRGSNGLYVRRESADRLESPLSGPGVQETGCGTARIKLANEVGVISAITSLTTIIGGNLTRRVAMVGLPHSAARKLVAKIPS